MVNNNNNTHMGVVGAGLTGCLLGIYLRKAGYKVTMFESREDPRKNQEGGRSINLVLTSRGIKALTGVSEALAERVMKITVPVFGRTLHQLSPSSSSSSSTITYQPYGPTPQHCNFSVSRWELNTVLLTFAEEMGCQVHFHHPITHVDIDNKALYFYLQDPVTTKLYQKKYVVDHIFGTDGGGSRCRQAVVGYAEDKGKEVQNVSQPLRYGYKELTMPKPPPEAKMDIFSLHIWPRGSHFLMALPNSDHSYTITLYLPESEGELSFAKLNTPAKVKQYFEKYYPDAVDLMPDFEKEYAENRVGFLGTIFASPWVVDDSIALVGDAAHAFTPFFGQGCNSGFEDVSVFSEILEQYQSKGMKEVFNKYFLSRKPNGDAIGNMALDNFDEMMSRTADERFLLEKAIEIELSNKFPKLYASRYVLVTHSLVGYDLCKQVGLIQEKILHELSRGIKSVNEVDYVLAEKLIQQHLVPFWKKNNISHEDFNYSSKYYPTQRSKL